MIASDREDSRQNSTCLLSWPVSSAIMFQITQRTLGVELRKCQ